MTEIIYSLPEIKEVAKKVIDSLQHKIVLFNAPMGAGKTTLIKELSEYIGVNDITSSPTFSIVNEYKSETTGERVYHFDLYRINDEEEAYDMGMDEYLDSNSWCFIEWPEKTPTIIPDEHAVIEIEILEDGNRKLVLKNN